MAPLIDQHGLVRSDPWRCIGSAEELDEACKADNQHLILSVSLWQAYGQRLRERDHSVGVWLGPEDEPEQLAPVLASLPIIAVQFTTFTDGRGYSLGRILRERMGYAGEMRAVGDILRDQIYLLHKCGFSSFALRADQSPEEAVAALKDFSWSPLVGRQTGN
ncbi:DUF934 domain-containing protein [Azovibrio restrictus]|uniref:DUF934 domain-containing protein n=1 Tax=Azovibrio restrictus TaxID=146938 RepID=UPI0026EFDA98|nr:DUF934 domain-containing protein [Azovibrio restrictus]MDD3481760.1 DUF934 domain-containing protein [Azovibrio restrictus]